MPIIGPRGNVPRVKPSLGRTVLYFPVDERRPAGRPLGLVCPAIVTHVHDRPFDPATGEEVGPWVVALTFFAPPPLVQTRCYPGLGETLSIVDGVSYVPLAGMYDAEDLLQHPEWLGCWNWPPRVIE